MTYGHTHFIWAPIYGNCREHTKLGGTLYVNQLSIALTYWERTILVQIWKKYHKTIHIKTNFFCFVLVFDVILTKITQIQRDKNLIQNK